MNRKKIGTINYYVHSSKESNAEYFNDLDEQGFFDHMTLEEVSKFQHEWIYTNMEVELLLDVYSDGSSKIIEVDGKKVLSKPKQMKLFK